MRPPLLADDFIIQKTGTYVICAQRKCVTRAERLR
jgi:hypothetical protein